MLTSCVWLPVRSPLARTDRLNEGRPRSEVCSQKPPMPRDPFRLLDDRSLGPPPSSDPAVLPESEATAEWVKWSGIRKSENSSALADVDTRMSTARTRVASGMRPPEG